MHLTIHNHDEGWWSTEVILINEVGKAFDGLGHVRESLGYGTYSFQTTGRLDILDPDVVFGAFTWDTWGDDELIDTWPWREIDFEDTRWRNANDPKNAQMVVQPWNGPCDNVHRYTIPDLSEDDRLTRYFVWKKDRIEFVALLGHQEPEDRPAEGWPPGILIKEWVFEHDPGAGCIVPEPGRETFRFNLWLLGDQPANGVPVDDIVINKFSFTPIPEPSTCTLAVLGLLCVGVYGMLVRRRRRQ